MLQGRALGRWREELDNWTKDCNSSLHPTMMDSHETSAFLYIPYADAQFLNNDNYGDAASVLEYESVEYQGVGRAKEARPMVTSDFSSNGSEREVTLSKIIIILSLNDTFPVRWVIKIVVKEGRPRELVRVEVPSCMMMMMMMMI